MILKFAVFKSLLAAGSYILISIYSVRGCPHYIEFLCIVFNTKHVSHQSIYLYILYIFNYFD